jgi:hypothetical protein
MSISHNDVPIYTSIFFNNFALLRTLYFLCVVYTPINLIKFFRSRIESLGFLLQCLMNTFSIELTKIGFHWSSFIELNLFSSTTQTKNKMQCRFFLNIIITQCLSIFELLSGKNETLLVRWYSFFVLNFLFHVFNRIGYIYI